MTQIAIFHLESIETRYTSQWCKYIPKIIKEFCKRNNIEIEIFNINGENISNETSPGAFLNFLETNIFKNTQVNNFYSLVKKGKIRKGCKLLFLDAWNSNILQCKYISDLLDFDFEIHSLFHAGSYDPNDFLGRKIKDKRWSYNVERSYYYASTKNYFATDYHKKLFLSNLEVSSIKKALTVGFPFEYLKEELTQYKNLKKENIILFPHRISDEKQPEIFKKLSKLLPQYQFIICQEQNLTKHEYHTLLGKSKMIFSANLQETLGISCYEGALVNSLPYVPDRLSYTEMYPEEVKYSSRITESIQDFDLNYETMKVQIESIMEMEQLARNNYCEKTIKQLDTFFNSEKLLKYIFNLL